ncbi:PREDICTED: phospholipase A2 [Condylura cristata]|uniref:phospholipase A2 n=1 Tax=Condylura cristata TaxID=143302 RepID=UPI0003346618|nr:PREDICTED: phospholipase A2 [Condylura cristata]
MKLLVLAALLSVASVEGKADSRSVLQFRKMIKCVIPDSHPALDFADYGCYCGLGGYGTPVDELDTCCQTHDNCYEQSRNVDGCRFLLDNPYTRSYSYSCSGTEITCNSKNTPCQEFLCNCDRTAAICFSKAPYNKEHHNLDLKKYCKK